MANRILSDEFQQGWISKVVPALEKQRAGWTRSGLLIQVGLQTSYVTFVDEFDGTTKCCIFDPLLVRQVQAIGERWFFNVAFSASPSSEIHIRGQL